MRVLIADKNEITRRIIKLLVNSKSYFKMIGEVKNIENLHAQLKDLKPDLVILNSDLAGEENLNLISKLTQIENRPYLISMDGNPIMETQALKAGADAFFLKGNSAKGLLTSLETVRLLHAKTPGLTYDY